MWGGPGSVAVRSEISPYAGMGRSVSIKALATSVNVSEKAQKKIGDPTLSRQICFPDLLEDAC